jgi:hypothetical protein
MSTEINVVEQVINITEAGDVINVNVVDAPVLVSVTDQIVEVSFANVGPQGPAGPGVAPGGTAGNILLKSSSSDYDTGWSDRNATLGEFGLTAGFLQVDTTPTNTPEEQGTMYWDADAETVALVMNGTIQKIGEDVFFHVQNKTGSSIPKGSCVRFDGTDGNSGKLLIAPFLADGSFPSQYFMGVTAETIANDAFGKVYHFGKIRGVNTSAYQDGDILYASTTVVGGFQTIAPVAPNNIIIVAAVVSAKNNGVLMVRSTLGSNINNDEGVLITNPMNGQTLIYDGSDGLWKNTTAAAVGTVTSVAATGGTGISVTGSPITSAGTLTITNTAPDQVVSIAGAGTAVITGSYPNFTVTANDQFTGTVTSVDLTAGTGISVSGGPVTSSGSITVNNTAPDQVVALTGSGTTTVSGTYPNFTITSADQFTGTVTSVDITVPTGLTVSGNPITSSGTLAIALASGYSIPTTASQANWDTAYNNRIDALTTTGNSGAATLASNTLNVPEYTLSGLGGVPSTRSITINGTAFDLSADRTYSVGTVTDVAALTLGTTGTDVSSTVANGTTTPVITLNIPTASATNRGALSSADWSTFSAKEPAITAGTSSQYYRGDKTFQTLNTAAVAEQTNLYFTEDRVRGTVLTGLNLASGGTIAATDSVLQAFGKVQNQISALVGGVNYDGTWDASTNTPTIVSGTGSKGDYYVVSVAGSTNIDGITDWKIGDWIIFNGTVWDKVDNTDAVSSVNGYVGTVSLVTGDVLEGAGSLPSRPSQLYFTDARARLALSAGTGISYDNTTGVITNASPDQTVALTGGGTTSISGTYPNFTITSNDQFVGTVTSVATSAPLTGGTITTTGTIGITQSSSVADGYLSSTDWNTFNSKEPALTKGNLTEATSSVLTITGGTGAVIGSGTSIQVKQASSTVSGFLSSTDWNTFNGKYNLPSLTSGSVLFSNGTTIAQDNANFFWDDTNNRLGIGTASPTNKINILNNGNSIIAFRIDDTNANGSFLSLNASNSDAAIIANGTSGIPLDFYTGGSKKMTLDSSGNLGLGVTPSAWNDGFVGFEIKNKANNLSANGGSYFEISQNATWNSGWKYVNTARASRYEQGLGEHFWFTAPSGTAGNAITFTQAMTLNASGNLSIGNTNDTYKLDVSGTGRFTGQLSASLTSSGTPLRIDVSTGGNVTSNTKFVIGTGGQAGSQANKKFLDIDFNGYLNYTFARIRSWDESSSTGQGSLYFYTNSGTTDANILALQLSHTGAATFSSSVTANSTINGYFGGITTGQSPASSGTSPNNPMLSLTNNRGAGLYVGGQHASPFGIWLQVSDTSNLATNYPLLLQPNGGNVGINTASPNAKMQIVGSGGARATMLQLTSGGTSDEGLFINTTGTGNDFYAIKVSTGANANAFALTNAGNVGIGTASPAYKLDLTSSNDGYARQWLAQQSFVGTGNGTAGFQVRTIDATSNGVRIMNAAANATWLTIASTGAATFSSSVQTGAPSGGTAKPIKFGAVQAASSLTGDALQVEVDGVVYLLGIVSPP